MTFSVRGSTAFGRSTKRTLCLVVAFLVALCALMIALPSSAHDLNNHMSVVDCHDTGAQFGAKPDRHHSNLIDGLNEMPSPLSNGHATVCAGDYLKSDDTTTGTAPALAIEVSLAVLYLVAEHRPVELQTHIQRDNLGPPFSSHIRSHLGLGRIHI